MWARPYLRIEPCPHSDAGLPPLAGGIGARSRVRGANGVPECVG